MCRAEAVSLPDRAAGFRAETGLPFSYIITLFQDENGDLPAPDDAFQYWAAVGEPDFPTTADTRAAILSATPYAGDVLPGKCVLGPRMEILACEPGQVEDDWAFEIIRQPAGL
jgi:hypothetical protein